MGGLRASGGPRAGLAPALGKKPLGSLWGHCETGVTFVLRLGPPQPTQWQYDSMICDSDITDELSPGRLARVT